MQCSSGCIRVIVLCLLSWQATLLFPVSSRAQAPLYRSDTPVLRTTAIHDAVYIDSLIGIYVDTDGKVRPEQLPGLAYDTNLVRRFTQGVPTNVVSLPFYCRFTLVNDQEIGIAHV